MIGDYREVLFPGSDRISVRDCRRGDAVAATAQRRRHARGGRLRPDVASLYVLIAFFAFWASFGPDAGLYRVFYETLPIFSFLRAPGTHGYHDDACPDGSRVGHPRHAARIALKRPWAAAATAGGARRRANWRRCRSHQFRDAEPLSPVYQRLATLPAGPVAEFPYWYQRSDFPRHASYMLNSTAHWFPLVNGYSDHIPADFRRNVIPLSSFPSRESFSILGAAGARYVIFHTHLYDARSRARLTDRLASYSTYLRPIAQEGSVWLYEIVGWPN